MGKDTGKRSTWDDMGKVSNPGTNADDNVTNIKRAFPPEIFRVVLSGDKQHVWITVGFEDASLGRNSARYRVYFAQATLVQNEADMDQRSTWTKVFNGSKLIASIDAPSVGGVASLFDRQYVGVDGWYFATSVSPLGKESNPAPPARAPLTSAADASVPNDVTAAQASTSKLNIKGSIFVQVSTSALAPTPLGSFAGYQIYIYNYRNSGIIEEGPFISSPSGTGAGALLSGSFLLSPDVVAPMYQSGYINVTNGSATITASGAASWDPGWGVPYSIAFRQIDAATLDGSLTLYKRQINTVSATSIPHTMTVFGITTWRTGTALPYVIYQTPNVGDSASEPHLVRLYFVALSQAGTRRSDITNSPFVDLPFGMAAALSPPQNPVTLTYKTNGTTITLTWQVSVGGVDLQNLQQFTVYRARAGTYLTMTDPARPPTPYATVKVDNTNRYNGYYTWVDRQFNIDNTISPDTTDTGWDYDPRNPGRYRYWVTSVNVEGMENRQVFAGTVSTTSGSTAFSWVSGDVFTYDMAGAGIIFYFGSPSGKVVASVTSATAADTFTNLPTTSSGVEYIVGPATQRIVLLGNSGSEDDVTIYRDNFSQRLFNARLDASTAAAADRAVELAFNAGYAATVSLATDGQYTFPGYYSVGNQNETTHIFAAASTGRQSIVAAPSPNPNTAFVVAGTIDGDASWHPWQYLRSGGTRTIPVFRLGAARSNGIVFVDGTGGADDASAYTGIVQMAKMKKFLNGENVVLSVYGKRVGSNTASTVRLQLTRFDPLDYSGAPYNVAGTATGIERDNLGADFSMSTLITSDWTRLTAIGTLPSGPVATLTGISCTNGSATVTGSGFNTVTGGAGSWIGNEILLVDGGSSFTGYILAIVSANQLTLTANCTFTSAGNATATITPTFYYYMAKLMLIGNGANYSQMEVTKPMVNGGVIGAAWTDKMRTDDIPGGDNGTATGASDGDPDKPPVACVVGGTKVWTTDRGEIPIEELRVGDRVVSRASNSKHSYGVIKALHRMPIRKLYTIKTERFHVTCSPTHVFGIVGEGRVKWKEAQRLEPGERVFVFDGSEVREEEIESIEDEAAPDVVVYTLTVSRHENYFAGGILSHNKPGDLDT